MSLAPEPTSPPTWETTDTFDDIRPPTYQPQRPMSPIPMGGPGYDGLAAWGSHERSPVYPPAVAPWAGGYVQARPSSTVAVWALITGVLGLLAGWCMFGLPCIAAVILGHVALAETRNDRKSGRGMAVAGLVLGYVALLPALILCVWVVAGGLLGAGGAAVGTPSPSFT